MLGLNGGNAVTSGGEEAFHFLPHPTLRDCMDDDMMEEHAEDGDGHPASDSEAQPQQEEQGTHGKADEGEQEKCGHEEAGREGKSEFQERLAIEGKILTMTPEVDESEGEEGRPGEQTSPMMSHPDRRFHGLSVGSFRFNSTPSGRWSEATRAVELSGTTTCCTAKWSLTKRWSMRRRGRGAGKVARRGVPEDFSCTSCKRA